MSISVRSPLVALLALVTQTAVAIGAILRLMSEMQAKATGDAAAHASYLALLDVVSRCCR